MRAARLRQRSISYPESCGNRRKPHRNGDESTGLLPANGIGRRCQSSKPSSRVVRGHGGEQTLGLRKNEDSISSAQ